MIGFMRQRFAFHGFSLNGFADVGAIAGAVLLIVGAILVWVSHDEYRRSQDAEYRLLEAHARNADLQVARALGVVDGLLEQVAEDWGAGKGAEGGTFAASLEKRRRELPELGSLLVTDGSGRVVAATVDRLRGRDLSAAPYVAAHLGTDGSRRMFMSRPGKELLGVPAVVLTRPWLDRAGRVRGVVGATIGFRFFPQVLAAINPDDSASATVIFNRDGDLLLRRADPEKFFGHNIAKTSSVFREHFAQGGQVTRHIAPSAIDGETRLLLVRDVEGTGLSLILSRQLDHVLAQWRRNAISYGLIFFFTSLVVIALAVVAARNRRQVLAAKAFSEQLIATANVMVVGLDKSGCVTIFNQRAERVSGYRREEMLGRNWFDAVLPADAAATVRQMFNRFQRGGELPHVAEFAIRTKAGQERVVSWQNSVIEAPRVAICFGIDVTERKQMEAERERFVAMVSHEFRTPLATIDGAIQHLEMNAQRADEATRKRYDKIQKAVDRLTLLLDDYLLQEHLGRVASGLDLVPVSPRVLLEDLQLSSSALSADHQVIVEAGDMPQAVLCDADLMRLALRVLGDNAVKYTPPGSEIRLGCREAGEGVEFYVRDNGPGVPADELPRLFDKFFRGRGAAQQSGTGIGLHLARSVVASHGGSLTACNRVGGGMEFKVWLPDVPMAACDSREQPSLVRI